MRVSTVSAAETALLLMKGLGPLRSWRDFLADNIRGRQEIDGLMLLPCCKQHDGRSYRPRYAVPDIGAFIKAVLSKIPEKLEIKSVHLELDPTKAWSVQKFDQHGAPIHS